MRDLIPFGRDVPCPACGIALEIRRVCAEPHADLAAGSGGVGGRPAHLHVECPGCRWSGYMSTASEKGSSGDDDADADRYGPPSSS